MATWQGKSRGTVLGYRIFAFLLKSFGYRAAYLLLYFVAMYYVFFSPQSTRDAYRFFRKAHQYGRLRALLSVYGNYFVFGQTIIDKVGLMAGVPGKFTFEFEGENHLYQMVENGTGGLLISAHLGNWDIAGHLLHRLNAPFNVVMFDQEHERIKSYFASLSFERRFRVIVIREDMSHIFEIKSAIARNELVCIHGDRFLPGSKTFTQTFFGKEARFPAGPYSIATKFEIPCSFVFAAKESATHYHFYATPGFINKGRPEEMLPKYVSSLEEKVRKYPKQWFNFYDFWKA